MNKTKERLRERQQRQRRSNMLIAMIVVGVLLVTSGVYIAKNALENRPDTSLVEVRGQPSLMVDKELIDYGEVKLNTNLTFTLNLTNVGDQPLMISETPYVEVAEGC